jgi:hypothetical protein
VPAEFAYAVVHSRGRRAAAVGRRRQKALLEVEGDFIRAIHNVANPDKLAHLNLPPTSGQERWLRA